MTEGGADTALKKPKMSHIRVETDPDAGGDKAVLEEAAVEVVYDADGEHILKKRKLESHDGMHETEVDGGETVEELTVCEGVYAVDADMWTTANGEVIDGDSVMGDAAGKVVVASPADCTEGDSRADDSTVAVSPSPPLEIYEMSVLIEKGKHLCEDLPEDWVMVTHHSGMPLYMHKPTGVCTLARPYTLGTRNLQKHDLPMAGVPCLLYRSEKSKEAAAGVLELASRQVQADQTENGESNNGMVLQTPSRSQKPSKLLGPEAYISPQALHDYCKTLFDFKTVSVPKTRDENGTNSKASYGQMSQSHADGLEVLSYLSTLESPATFQADETLTSDDGKFMDTEEVIKLLVGAPALEAVPCGTKDNMSFVVHNEKNEERRARGKRSHFSDDCGSWCSKGATTSRTTFIVDADGNLKTAVYFCDGQWGTRRFVGGELKFVAIEPQPEPSHVLTVYRYYSRLKSNTSFQRRITWVGQRPPSVPESVIGKAVYEYRGCQEVREGCTPNVLHTKRVRKPKIKE